MLITGVQVGSSIYPLTEGQPLGVVVGETIRIFFAFKYKMPERTDAAIWASLYKYTVGILDRQGKAQTKGTITLDETTEWKDYQGYIDIVVGSVPAGTYGLIVELPGRKDAEAKIDDCIEVTAAPSIWEMIGPLLVLGLMVGLVSMMAPMMEEGFG